MDKLIKPIEYLANWAALYYGSADHDLASSGLPDPSFPVPPISRGCKWFDQPAGEVIEYSRKLVADRYGVKPEQVILTMGASGALFYTAFVMSQFKKPVVIETPIYEPVWRDFEVMGTEIRWLKRERKDGYRIKPLLDKASELAKGASCLVLVNPNNPTGQYETPESLAELADAIKPAILFVNEAYLRQVKGGKSAWGCAENIAIMQTLTKSWGVSIPRFGWLITPEPINAEFNQACYYVAGATSATSAAAAIPVLENLDQVHNDAMAHVIGRHKLVDDAFRNHPRLNWLKPPDNVIIGTFTVDGVTDYLEFAKAILEKHKVILGPGVFFGEPGIIRMGIGAKPEKFDKGFEILLEFARDYKE